MSRAMTQVKFTIDSSIVSAFKAQCASEGVSMASTICQWMKTGQPIRTVMIKMNTRRHRRKAAMEIIRLLNALLEEESGYRYNIPEQFEQRYESADYACERLSEAISLLEDAFQ
jgi:hypothetical protein